MHYMIKEQKYDLLQKYRLQCRVVTWRRKRLKPLITIVESQEINIPLGL